MFRRKKDAEELSCGFEVILLFCLLTLQFYESYLTPIDGFQVIFGGETIN